MNLSELMKVSGNENVLRHLVRLSYFFNMGYLTEGIVP